VTIIADTSPLHYAVLIGAGEAVFYLYGHIVIPTAVHLELLDVGAPESLRQWVKGNLHRIEIRQVSLTDDPHLRMLDAGEAEAIQLAHQTADSLLIIDEKDGRAEAKRRGLKVTGLLGVIRDAAFSGYIDFEETLGKLKRTDFRLSSEIETLVRAQYKSSN
jgi:predicted nucleic acid-binding protein